MAGNHLEQLVAEWYEFQGWFCRRNVKHDKRDRGGYEGEIDLAAYHPHACRIVHVECSMDADSWAQRDEKFTRKFSKAEETVRSLFSRFPVAGPIERRVILGDPKSRGRETLGGGSVVLLPELCTEILDVIGRKPFPGSAVPEHLPLLRAMQIAWNCRASQ